ncbi:Nucleoside-diphosphate-sugar epimerase [Pseudomonas sp. NFACC25]|uniref:NAD-dependent epimerase/dehydratase family protein n=1 Tax=Pseudomonas sp. NFACC25 TaxID=1566188 RepID=UPI0008763688|nr:NAD(P)-dependent oxidoreductase [Pseudomonas sp. NFACC25]SCX36173.1 Nucleoside-diphosphate-sugar epimerase [Pseudomonas sp. NFACC25]
MNILISGANGLLGAHSVAQLVARHQVHAIVHTAPDVPLAGVNYHVLDLSQAWSPQLLPTSVDAVIHLAQSSRFREFPDQALDVFGVNVASTARLLDYAKSAGARHFILASSGGGYGAGNEAFKENAQIPHPGQLGYYLGSKLCSEVLAHNYASLMNVTVLRFFFMYGKDQKRSMLVPRLIDNVMSGQAITLHGNDGIKINPIHVSDAVAALEHCLGLEGSHTFNVAGTEVLSLRDIAGIIGTAVGRDPIFNIEEIESRNLIANIDSLSESLITPRVSFAQGILELIP